MTYEYAGAYMNDAVWIDYKPDAEKPSMASVLGPVALAPKGRNRRVSSNQQPDWHSENLDMTWLLPGESVNMPVLEGPGVITHMWFTSHAGWVGNCTPICGYYRQKQPGVESLRRRFAVGQGNPQWLTSRAGFPTGAATCYWRMPHPHQTRGCRDQWQLTVRQACIGGGLAAGAGSPQYLTSTRYRQEYPPRGRDYLWPI
jgi:hypothetical protein